ncbi:MAG: hypothetical protein J4F28_03040 [Nitrosopumilaceae archaeon]|nr:hypothetical protein [Nitrosopumilaceae archaeon]
MRRIVMLPILLGAAAAVSFAGLLASGGLTAELPASPQEPAPSLLDSPPPQQQQQVDLGRVFTYYDVERVSAELEARGLSMSLPVPITDHTIPQYCSYYDAAADGGGLVSTSYCTTSGIVDTNGITVGNVNLGGDISSPVVAVIALDPVPPTGTSRGHADAIFESVIAGLVCDCWHEQEPGGFESVSAWMTKAESLLDDSEDGRPLKSTISGLGGTNIILEAAPAPGGYQWTMFILQ